MFGIPLLLLVIVGVALFFDYTNGAHTTATTIAPVISTRVMSPRAAVIMAASLTFGGALVGMRVADTLGRGIVEPAMIQHCQTLALAALIGAVCWNLLSRRLGLPSATSYALIGGLIGAAVAKSGWGVLQVRSILTKVIIPFFVAPLIGFAAGYFLMVGLAWLTWRCRYRRADRVFQKLELLAAVSMIMSHGSNSAQKTMGLITLSLFTFGMIPLPLVVPAWVKFACAAAITLGTLTGGWKIIKTMGNKIFKMRPVHGFAAQTAASLVITYASMAGAPVSTTQVIASSVLGVGSARRLSAVNWDVGINLVSAWLFTIPVAAVAGAGCMVLLGLLGL